MLNHEIPFSIWSMDCAYKESGKLRSHYGASAIEKLYCQNDDGRHDRSKYPIYSLKTTADQLTAKEKKCNIWHLAETDARKTHPLSSNTFVISSGSSWLPLDINLSPGLIPIF